jgi:hypothetical protein
VEITECSNEASKRAIQEYMGQDKVHTAIWSNIHRKRFNLADQALICAGMLQEEFGYA